MTTEELLIRDTGRWVSAESLWEADDAQPSVALPVLETRRCQGSCRKDKPVLAFEGLHGRLEMVCEDCRTKARSAARQQPGSDKLRVCKECGNSKPLTSYYWVDSHHHDLGRRETCSTCCRKAVVGAWPVGAAKAIHP
jgi:hypothetical protein